RGRRRYLDRKGRAGRVTAERPSRSLVEKSGGGALQLERVREEGGRADLLVPGGVLLRSSPESLILVSDAHLRDLHVEIADEVGDDFGEPVVLGDHERTPGWGSWACVCTQA